MGGGVVLFVCLFVDLFVYYRHYIHLSSYSPFLPSSSRIIDIHIDIDLKMGGKKNMKKGVYIVSIIWKRLCVYETTE